MMPICGNRVTRVLPTCLAIASTASSVMKGSRLSKLTPQRSVSCSRPSRFCTHIEQRFEQGRAESLRGVVWLVEGFAFTHISLYRS